MQHDCLPMFVTFFSHLHSSSLCFFFCFQNHSPWERKVPYLWDYSGKGRSIFRTFSMAYRSTLLSENPGYPWIDTLSGYTDVSFYWSFTLTLCAASICQRTSTCWSKHWNLITREYATLKLGLIKTGRFELERKLTVTIKHLQLE